MFEGKNNNKTAIGILRMEPERKPLFTTEDGKEIFEGDEYWFIYLHDGMLAEWWKPYSTKTSSLDMALQCGHFQFSTKEAAEAYIKDNKPEFSRKQIREAWRDSRDLQSFCSRFGIDLTDSDMYISKR